MKPLKIVITGPESTGKSTLTTQLANYYQGVCIPEYARSYIENLPYPYTYNDIEHIAREQVKQMHLAEQTQTKIIFFDTYLIITKVWFDVVYGFVPQWLNQAIEKAEIDLFLLCNTDLLWEPDPVRENGGEMREILFERYRHEIQSYGFSYQIIEGQEKSRFKNAVRIVDEFLNVSLPVK